MPRAWRTLASLATDRGPLELRQRDDLDFLITIGGRVLMTSSARRSEEALATLACAQLAGRSSPRVLIGGLGMGYTLRAALDALPAKAQVVVVELHPEIVQWCRGPLAPLTQGAVLDERVEIVIDDVSGTIAAAQRGTVDAILIDLYEGPSDVRRRPEDPFYGPAALRRARAALAPGGVLAIWAEAPSAPFARTFVAEGFEVSMHRAGRGGRSHVIWLGRVAPG